MKKFFLFLFILFLILTLHFLTPGVTWINDRYDNWLRHGNPKSQKPKEKLQPTKKPMVNRKRLDGFCGVSSFGLCHYDIDCYISGCNAEICQSKNEQPIMSACVILDCHKKPEGIFCGCKEGECQWLKK